MLALFNSYLIYVSVNCGKQSFARGLHEHSLKLSVDVAGWSPVWNYDALAQSSADSFISMVSE